MNRLHWLFLLGIASVSLHGSEATEGDKQRKGSKRGHSTLTQKSTPQDALELGSSPSSSSKRLKQTPPLVPDSPVETPSALTLSAITPFTMPHMQTQDPMSDINGTLTSILLNALVHRVVNLEKSAESRAAQILELVKEQTTTLTLTKTKIDAEAKTRESQKQQLEGHEQCFASMLEYGSRIQNLITISTKQVEKTSILAKSVAQCLTRLDALEKEFAQLKQEGNIAPFL